MPSCGMENSSNLFEGFLARDMFTLLGVGCVVKLVSREFLFCLSGVISV
jgi:hypothetical protein